MPDEWHIQGIAVSSLVESCGTPLYVYDSEVLIRQYRRLRERLHPSLEIFYSLKANPNVAICSVLTGLGAGAEVSSLVELCVAQRAGAAAENIVFLGPGKSFAELASGLDSGIHAVICESWQELEALDALSCARGVRTSIILRVNPAFTTKRSGLTMGGKARQFGIDEEQLTEYAALADRFRHLSVAGIHVYMGTRILDASTIVENTRQILNMAERIAECQCFELRTVDVGGGFGVPYFDGEQDLDIEVLAQGLEGVIADFSRRHPATRLITELGRYLVALCGTYVVRIQYTKTSYGERFAVTDGGTHHHMAAVGVGSFAKRNFPARVLNDTSGRHEQQPWHVTGPLCTPNDTLLKNVAMPKLVPGDLIGVERSGAYGPTASPGLFLSHGYPAEVLVHEGRAHLVRRRDSPEDLLANQLLPGELNEPSPT